MKIISGAQTGADMAALEAAEEHGYETGGYVPKGCRTELRNRPELIPRFNLIELELDDYRPRTKRNVAESDATVIFKETQYSLGCRLTINECVEKEKPHLVLRTLDEDVVGKVVAFIRQHEPKVLNIAGTRESKALGTQVRVKKILLEVFDILEESDAYVAAAAEVVTEDEFLDEYLKER